MYVFVCIYVCMYVCIHLLVFGCDSYKINSCDFKIEFCQHYDFMTCLPFEINNS